MMLKRRSEGKVSKWVCLESTETGKSVLSGQSQVMPVKNMFLFIWLALFLYRTVEWLSFSIDIYAFLNRRLFLTFTNRISRSSQEVEGVRLVDLVILSLLFVNYWYMVLLVPSCHNPQLSLSSEELELQGKDLCVPVSLFSYLHLWSQILGIVTQSQDCE